MGRTYPGKSAGEYSQRYAARMVYLSEEDEETMVGGSNRLEPMGRSLKPPCLFMSRRQARADFALCAQRARKKTAADPVRGVRAQVGEKKHLGTRKNETATKANHKSERKGLMMSDISLEDKPANWRRVKEAGVVFWVNDFTGVATEECPCDSLRPLADSTMVTTHMFLGATACTVACSSAFVAPMAIRSMVHSSSCTPKMQSEGSAYVQTLPGAPFGDGKIFDPLGLSKGASPSDIKKWRDAEIKHGRVAMLAALGVLVAEEYHPLFMGPDYIGPAVDHFQEITAQYPAFWAFALLGMGLIESNTISTAFDTPSAVTGEGGLKPDYSPGDLGFDPLGLKPEDEEELRVIQTKELNNGRLAMIGIAGMLVQELVKPQDILEFLN